MLTQVVLQLFEDNSEAGNREVSTTGSKDVSGMGNGNLKLVGSGQKGPGYFKMVGIIFQWVPLVQPLYILPDSIIGLPGSIIMCIFTYCLLDIIHMDNNTAKIFLITSVVIYVIFSVLIVILELLRPLGNVWGGLMYCVIYLVWWDSVVIATSASFQLQGLGDTPVGVASAVIALYLIMGIFAYPVWYLANYSPKIPKWLSKIIPAWLEKFIKSILENRYSLIALVSLKLCLIFWCYIYATVYIPVMAGFITGL